MDLEEFKSRIQVFSPADANEWRERFVATFIDKTRPEFATFMQLRPFPDGMYYRGYLWDFLNCPEIITYDTLLAELQTLQNVIVFWDVHSSHQILIPNYWKIGRDTVFRSHVTDVIAGIQYLPEDIYIFDDSMLWTLVTTHEY